MKKLLQSEKVRKISIVTFIFVFGFFSGVVFSSLHYELSSKNAVVDCDDEIYGETVDVQSLKESFVLKETTTEKVIENTEKVNEKININTASAEELIALPGIGEAIAKSIIDYRTENGNFSSVEEIMNVKRIGEKTFEEIKDLITV